MECSDSQFIQRQYAESIVNWNKIIEISHAAHICGLCMEKRLLYGKFSTHTKVLSDWVVRIIFDIITKLFSDINNGFAATSFFVQNRYFINFLKTIQLYVFIKIITGFCYKLA